MLNGMQASQLIFILLFAYSHSIKPPGYVEPEKAVDPRPPKYEYGYDIVGDKGGHQGKQEQRDGIYASGRYFVENKNAKTDVQYFADDWGYHPAVEYSNTGPHSKSSAKFALGHEAVVQLRNKENNLPQLQGLPDTGPLNKDGTGGVVQTQTIRPILQPSPQPQNHQQFLLPVPSQQSILQQNIIKHDPQPPYDPFKQQQILIQEQPQVQQVIKHEPQQQLLIQEQPQLQVVQHEHQKQQQEVLIQDQPQLQHEAQHQQILIQEQPQFQHEPQQEQVLIQEQPQFQHELQQQQQQQQIVIQHIQQPVQKVIFPQPSPTPIVYQNQEHQQLVEEQQQPNIVLLGQQKLENIEQIQHQAISEKLVQSEEQANAISYQQFGLKIKGRRPNKLIESTQHLVTGQDVLDINSAVTNHEETSFPSTTPYPTVTEYTVTEPSFKTQPIIVADVEENKIVSSTERYNLKEEQFLATTAGTIESVSTTFESTSPTSTIVVTPRPVSTTFLAPITAGVRLESTGKLEDNYKLNKQNIQIEIQKTVPYYLGKYEYPSLQDQYVSNDTLVDQKVREDIELGKTLLYFPGHVSAQKQLNEVDHNIAFQQLPNPVVQNNFLEIDQQLAQGYQHQIYLQQIPIQQTKEVTKLIPQPYPVKVPYEVPVPVVKQVAVPVTVEKIVEKPIHITKFVDRPVPVPQPYPVEKIVEKPVHIPVQVTKYIDRPYPVHVQVPVPQPYPVEKIVEKFVKQPYPVEVRVPYPVDRIVEKKVPVPQYIEKPVTVEKIVEKPVPQYIDRPYPVHVKVPYPQPVAVPVDRIVEKKVPVPHYIEKQVPVEKIVEKHVPQYIDRPYPVKVEVPVPQPYYIKVEVPKPYPVQVHSKFIEKPYYTLPVVRYHQINYGGVPLAPIKSIHSQTSLDSQVQSSYNSHVQSNLNVQTGYSNNAEQTQSQGYYYPNPYSYAPQNNFYLPPKKEIVLDNGYLPPVKNCDNIVQQTKQDNYIGLLPPKIGNTLTKFLRKYRSARSSFDDKSVKMEYGFMPPLVPSLEIDEYGNPIDKGNKK